MLLLHGGFLNTSLLRFLVQVLNRRQHSTCLQLCDLLSNIDALYRLMPKSFLNNSLLLAWTPLLHLDMTVTVPFEVDKNLKIQWMLSINLNVTPNESLMFLCGRGKWAQHWFLRKFFLVILLSHSFVNFYSVLAAVKKERVTVYHGNLYLTFPLINKYLNANVTNQWHIRV